MRRIHSSNSVQPILQSRYNKRWEAKGRFGNIESSVQGLETLKDGKVYVCPSNDVQKRAAPTPCGSCLVRMCRNRDSFTSLWTDRSTLITFRPFQPQR